jgi:glutamate/tyrosine decarboxylase-like PLP-dependent enzyme
MLRIPIIVSLVWYLFRVEKLGYPVPKFDFRLPGVTSMSADIHKYGYGAKVQCGTISQK